MSNDHSNFQVLPFINYSVVLLPIDIIGDNRKIKVHIIRFEISVPGK